MTRPLKLDILTSGDTRGIDKTAHALENAADKADHLGDELRDAASDASHLDRQLLITAATLKAIGHEFEKTGDAALLKDFRKESSTLANLKKIRSELDGIAKASPKLSGGAAGSGLNFAALPVNPYVAAGVAGAGIAAAPFVGGVAGGAVLSAGALGGVGLGVAGAAMSSPDVGKAFSAELDKIQGQWQQASQGFVQPVIDAIHLLGGAVESIHLDKILAKAATFVEPLSRGLDSFIRGLGAGFETLVDSAGPVVKVLGDELPELGDSFKKMFEDIADGADGGADALKDFFNLVEGVVEGTGVFIGAMEKAYGGLKSFAEGSRDVVGAINPLVNEMNKATEDGAVLAHRFRETADDADVLSGALTDMTSEVSLANNAFNSLFGTMMDVDEANLQVKKGFADLKKAQQDQGATQDEITKKVLQQIQALQSQREAQLATGDGSQAATDRINANYRAQLEQLKKMFPWLAALIDKYEELAKPLTKTITVRVIQVGSVSKEGVISSGDQRRSVGAAYASGGTVRDTGFAQLHKDEILWVNKGQYVSTAAEAKAMGMSATSTNQRGYSPVLRVVGGDSALATFLHGLAREGILQFELST